MAVEALTQRQKPEVGVSYTGTSPAFGVSFFVASGLLLVSREWKNGSN